MERVYIVENTAKFPVLLKELNVIVPEKSVVNLFELAPELKFEQIEACGILRLRLHQEILMLIESSKPKAVKPRIRKASEKRGPSKIVTITSEKKEKIKNKRYKINNKAATIKHSKNGMLVMEALEDEQ